MDWTPDVFPHEAGYVVVLVNPKAGRGPSAGRVARLVHLLNSSGLHVEVSSDLSEVAERAARLFEAGDLRALVGVGGDGTAAELVNRTQVGVPVTLLAAGTANLLAKHLGLSSRPERLYETLTAGQLVRMDAGRVGQRVFLAMVGCGFDAEVVRQVHQLRESSPRGAHISYLSYLRPIAESIRSYGYPEIRVYWDEAGGRIAETGLSPLAARWVFICNLPRYGWGVPLAPRAATTDGLLDLVTFRRGALSWGLWYAGLAQFAAHQRVNDCRMVQAARFRVVSEQPVAYQVDGDPGGSLPIEVEVLKGRCTFVVPRRAVAAGG